MKRDMESSGDREPQETGERDPRGWETERQRKLEKESQRIQKRAESWGRIWMIRRTEYRGETGKWYRRGVPEDKETEETKKKARGDGKQRVGRDRDKETVHKIQKDGK